MGGKVNNEVREQDELRILKNKKNKYRKRRKELIRSECIMDPTGIGNHKRISRARSKQMQDFANSPQQPGENTWLG